LQFSEIELNNFDDCHQKCIITIMKKSSLLIFFISYCVFSHISFAKSGDDYDFRDKFYKAKSYLAGGLINKALPIYQELYSMDSTNSNISYLLGVCYTEMKTPTYMSVYHLERVAENISLDYDPGAYLEIDAPVFAWYYMTIAYSQNGLCQKAISAAVKFKDLYGAHRNDFYTKDASAWVERCKNQQINTSQSLTVEEIPIDDKEEVAEITDRKNLKDEATQFDSNEKIVTPNDDLALVADSVADNETEEEMSPVADDPLKVDAIQISERKIVTKNINYETKTPLYGVQVGAFSRLVPIWKFENLNNVDAFMDNQDIIRYVIGHLTYVSQANILLKAVWEAGYKDAFIVDINSIKKQDSQRFKESIVSVDDVSFKAKVRGKVDYRIQIGAFKESIPDDLVQLYLNLEGIKENRDKDVTTLTIGTFGDYNSALLKRKELMGFGIQGAFVVAYNYERKIPVDEANNYLSKIEPEKIKAQSEKNKKKDRKLFRR